MVYDLFTILRLISSDKLAHGFNPPEVISNPCGLN